MTTLQAEKKTPSKIEQAANEIAESVANKFASFPQFTFAKTEYSLISAEGRDNIKKHMIKSLQELPLTDVDIDLLNKGSILPQMSKVSHAVVGDIKMKALPAKNTTENNPIVSDAKPYMSALVTGSSVDATGLCRVYFDAMTARVRTFAWNAASQVTAPALAAITNKFKSDTNTASSTASSTEQAHPVEKSVCMNDELVESKVSNKVLTVAVRQALLPFYTVEQLQEAMIELHNSKALFTAFLRTNTNKASALFGKDTHSWTQAVAHIKEEAQRRLDEVQQEQVAAPDATSVVATSSTSQPGNDERKAALQAIVNYDGGLFSATQAPAHQ